MTVEGNPRTCPTCSLVAVDYKEMRHRLVYAPVIIIKDLPQTLEPLRLTYGKELLDLDGNRRLVVFLVQTSGAS